MIILSTLLQILNTDSGMAVQVSHKLFVVSASDYDTEETNKFLYILHLLKLDIKHFSHAI